MKTNMPDVKQEKDKIDDRFGSSRHQSENEHEFESLEYEEDAYYLNLTATPSFDDVDELSDDADELVVHCWRDSNGDIDEIVVDDANLSVETQFLTMEQEDGARGRGRKKRKSVRVIFQDFSKPYLAKISNSQNYKKFLELVKGEDATLHSSGYISPSSDNVVNELQGLTLEEQDRQKAEWSAELAKVEEEIQTLRHVLANKIRVSQELKRKLGISVWKEITDDMNQGLKNVKESQVYQNVGEKLGQITKAVSENTLFQKTESVIKTTAEKTTSILGGFGSGLSMKLGQMRNSDSFRSLEERVGSAYENMKSFEKMLADFDVTLHEHLKQLVVQLVICGKTKTDKRATVAAESLEGNGCSAQFLQYTRRKRAETLRDRPPRYTYEIGSIVYAKSGQKTRLRSDMIEDTDPRCGGTVDIAKRLQRDGGNLSSMYAFRLCAERERERERDRELRRRTDGKKIVSHTNMEIAAHEAHLVCGGCVCVRSGARGTAANAWKKPPSRHAAITILIFEATGKWDVTTCLARLGVKGLSNEVSVVYDFDG
ncbi:Tumor protein D54 [Dufourea novaeangliae]|uniref:Tumor protein D54 n=1 Tax=Dufourea novaeangliae TaxID=178035 RepID=A0A154NZV0_DUFNO|nr:Tumor protein D54 [Dufourea novaeangliae]